MLTYTPLNQNNDSNSRRENSTNRVVIAKQHVLCPMEWLRVAADRVLFTTGNKLKITNNDVCDQMDMLCLSAEHISKSPVRSISPTNKRPPTPVEISKGVLPHVLVQEVVRKNSKHVDKYYWTPNGTRYRSIAEIKRATVFLNVFKDGMFYARVGRLFSDTSAEIVRVLSPHATLFYQGVGRSSKQMLGDFLDDSREIHLLHGKENIFKLM